MKIVKVKTNYYLENEETKIKLEPEVVHKYRLYSSSEVANLELVILDNQYYFYYKMALKRLSSMQSEYMLRKYLIEKGISKPVLNQVITELYKLRYLDDYEYALNYKDLKQYQWGPRKIEANLLTNGVNKEIINEVIELIDEEEILDNLLSKELRKIKSSIKSFEQKLIRKYYNKGFTLNIITKVLSPHLANIDYDESIDLEKEYYRLKSRLEVKDLTKNELKYQITQRLLRRGYKLDDIKKIEE